MKRLIELRKAKKLTQAKVAELLGISRAAYNSYELDTRQPDPNMLKQLADLFNTSVDYLLERTDDPQIYVQPPELPGLYYRLSKEAMDRGITAEDAEKIIELYKKYKT